MAIKADYVARETASNLGRNITITIASVLTITVSLALVGFSLMLRSAVENATQRWQGGIEFVVFLNPDATPEQIASVRTDLDESPDVDGVTFIDQQGAYEEFKTLFADSPEMIDTVSPEILPPSFRVVPRQKDAKFIEELARQYEGKAGVREVILASETIRVVQKFSGWVTSMVLLVAGALLIAATLLIVNTIRMAMYARRREIEVMKLVGATNWFIRLPFMLEGLVQGVMGSALAILVMFIGWPLFTDSLPVDRSGGFPMLSGFTVSSFETFAIYGLVGVVGCGIGAIGAGVAVTRFLDV